MAPEARPLTRTWSGTAYLAILEATTDRSSFTTTSASPASSFNTMKANAAGRRPEVQAHQTTTHLPGQHVSHKSP